MSESMIKIGDVTRFSKTVSESDVYLFAGITGDLSPNHVNQSYMEKSPFGTRMAHGALLVGFMSTVSTLAIAHRFRAAARVRSVPGADGSLLPQQTLHVPSPSRHWAGRMALDPPG